MARPQKVISEEICKKAKKALTELSRDNRVGIRLKAIIASREHGVMFTAKVFGTVPAALREWARRFDEEGARGLEYREGRGRISPVSREHCKKIKEWLGNNVGMTTAEITAKLKAVFNIKTSRSAVHRMMVRSGLAYITPRPLHYKQDKMAQNEFKKKSAFSI
jgi:transposase